MPGDGVEVRHEQAHPLRAHDPDVDAGSAAREGTRVERRVLHRAPGGLEEQPHLRVGDLGLLLGEPEELVVEGVGVVDEPRVPGVDRAGPAGRVVVDIGVPPCLGDLDHPLVAAHQQVPQPGRVRCLGEAAVDADDGDVRHAAGSPESAESAGPVGPAELASAGWVSVPVRSRQQPAWPSGSMVVTSAGPVPATIAAATWNADIAPKVSPMRPAGRTTRAWSRPGRSASSVPVGTTRPISPGTSPAASRARCTAAASTPAASRGSANTPLSSARISARTGRPAESARSIGSTRNTQQPSAAVALTPAASAMATRRSFRSSYAPQTTASARSRASSSRAYRSAARPPARPAVTVAFGPRRSWVIAA